MIYGREYDNKEVDLNRAHPFPGVPGYKRDSDIIEGDITKVRKSWDGLWILLLALTI